MNCDSGRVAALVILSLVALTGCPVQTDYHFRYIEEAAVAHMITQMPPDYPDVRFAVGSDVHFYSRTLGTTGAAFDDYLAHDRKLLVESEEIAAEIFEEVGHSNLDFMLICGDLTKDGELLNHTLLARYLYDLEETGTEVYVVPGNHDQNNPDAFRYSMAGTSPVDTATPDDFRSIYHDFGFSQAIAADDDSLSYVVEPVPGLWLLCLDSTDSDRNFRDGYPHVAGRFSPRTVTWIETQLIAALQQGKAVMAAMHHGVTPHWAGQVLVQPEYVVNRYEEIRALFAAYHVRCVFTGHYHSQDVALHEEEDGGFVYDIETGSFVTYPCPYREITVADGVMNINSHFVQAIPSHPDDFTEYAYQYGHDGLYGLVYDVLTDTLPLQPLDAHLISRQVADGIMAHYVGDEDSTGLIIPDMAGASPLGRAVLGAGGPLLQSLWTDSEGADNFLDIDLFAGIWTPAPRP